MKYTSSNNEPRDFYVAPGEYELRVVDAVETVAKGSGAEMIKLNLEVEGHGCRLFDYLIGTEATAWKVDAFRRALGETVVAEQQAEIIPQKLIGRTVRARLRIEEYNGKYSNKVDAWLEPLGEATGTNQTAKTQTQEDDDVPF